MMLNIKYLFVPKNKLYLRFNSCTNFILYERLSLKHGGYVELEQILDRLRIFNNYNRITNIK